MAATAKFCCDVVAKAAGRVKYVTPVPSDIAVSQSLAPLHIGEIAAGAGILESELDYYGRTKAKVSLSVRDRLAASPDGNYVVVRFAPRAARRPRRSRPPLAP